MRAEPGGSEDGRGAGYEDWLTAWPRLACKSTRLAHEDVNAKWKAAEANPVDVHDSVLPGLDPCGSVDGGCYGQAPQDANGMVLYGDADACGSDFYGRKVAAISAQFDRSEIEYIDCLTVDASADVDGSTKAAAWNFGNGAIDCQARSRMACAGVSVTPCFGDVELCCRRPAKQRQ